VYLVTFVAVVLYVEGIPGDDTDFVTCHGGGGSHDFVARALCKTGCMSCHNIGMA